MDEIVLESKLSSFMFPFFHLLCLHIGDKMPHSVLIKV